MLSRIKSALRNLRHKRQRESELDAEINSYVDAVVGEKTAGGLSPEQARRQTLDESGGMEQMKLAVREARAGAGIDLLWQDLCYALRQLTRNRVYAWTVVITLGLGIGATTSIFSAVYALLLRPLSYGDPSHLVYVSQVSPTGPNYHLMSPEIVAARNGLHSFSHFAGYIAMDANLRGAGDPARVQWVGVTANFLSMLEIKPSLGRDFTVDEERPGSPAVVLLSDRFWRSYFHADPSIVGRSVVLEGAGQITDREQTIVGVLPPLFSFPDFSLEPDVYGLLDLDPISGPAAYYKGVYPLSAVARLGPGVTREPAQAELETFFHTLVQSYPPKLASLTYFTTRHMVVESLHRHLAGDDRKPLLILLACVMAVLLIACANVANLQMARAVSRGHEIAVRGAFGASRYRLIRQSLVESLALSALGAAFGFGIAWLIIGLVRRSADITAGLSWKDRARVLDMPLAKISSVIHVDGWVLVFTVSLALLTALLFGLAPAISGSRTDLRNALQSAVQRITAGRRQRLFRHSLLLLEVALAVVLLASAGLLMQSFVNVLRYDAGFDARHALTGTIVLGHARYGNLPSERDFAEQLLPRLQAMPGVQAAALSTAVPLGAVPNGAFSLDDPNPPVGKRQAVGIISISPNYFRAVGTPLVQGRPFTIDDSATSAPVVIVNRSFARHYFSGDALEKRFYIGQTIDRGSGPEFGFVASTVVGIAADVRHNGIEHEVEPESYVPLSQHPTDGLNFILRSDLDTGSLANAVRRVVTSVDREQPLFDIQTMEERVSSLVSRRRLIMLLVACFAFLAALLAAVGVYGVFTYSLSQRVREIGIRLALGSSRAHLVRVIMVQAARLIATGSAAGIAVALLSARLLSGMLVGVKAHDLLSFTLAWTLMSCVALLASAFPALKAARTDPISVLHSE